MNKYLDIYFKAIKNLIPSKPEGSSVGLDIGAGDCKMVELTKADGSFELVSWGIEPVKGGDVSSSIKKAMSKVRNKSYSLYSAVFGNGTLIRYIDMPTMSLTDLRNSFSIEADKYFPFAQEQVYTDCCILETMPKEKQMSVLGAAAKKEIIDERIKLLTNLGFNVDFIGINPIALINVLNVLGQGSKEKEDSGIAFLDMGESVSNLTIVVDKVPRFTRDIFIGGRDITKRIANVLGISFEAAEKLKNNPGKRLEEISGSSENAIMSMVHEIRISFDYFSTEKNIEINKLFLTGGGSMLTGIADIFAKNLEISVDKWDPLAYLKIASGLSKDEINKNTLKLGVALGLALYEYD